MSLVTNYTISILWMAVSLQLLFSGLQGLLQNEVAVFEKQTFYFTVREVAYTAGYFIT